MELITCKQSKERGLPRYFTGKPCKRGHVSERYTSTGNCIACDNLRCNIKFHTCPKQKEYSREYNRLWAEQHPDRTRAWMKRWDAKNVEKRRADNMKRHAAKLQRMPKWADVKAIEAFYRACPPGHHVDHVIPLQGELVCGLHVENNLQYLTALDNIKKGNKFDVS